MIFENPFGGTIFIYWIGVASDYQRKGIGRALIEYIEEWAKRHHVHSLRLEADIIPLEFYKKWVLNSSELTKKVTSAPITIF